MIKKTIRLYSNLKQAFCFAGNRFYLRVTHFLSDLFVSSSSIVWKASKCRSEEAAVQVQRLKEFRSPNSFEIFIYSQEGSAKLSWKYSMLRFSEYECSSVTSFVRTFWHYSADPRVALITFQRTFNGNECTS